MLIVVVVSSSVFSAPFNLCRGDSGSWWRPDRKEQLHFYLFYVLGHWVQFDYFQKGNHCFKKKWKATCPIKPSHFLDEEVEAQKSWATSPESHSKSGIELSLWSRFPNTHWTSPFLFLGLPDIQGEKRWKKSKILSQVFCPIPNILVAHPRSSSPLLNLTAKEGRSRCQDHLAMGCHRGSPLLNWIFSLTSG